MKAGQVNAPLSVSRNHVPPRKPSSLARQQAAIGAALLGKSSAGPCDGADDTAATERGAGGRRNTGCQRMAGKVGLPCRKANPLSEPATRATERARRSHYSGDGGGGGRRGWCHRSLGKARPPRQETDGGEGGRTGAGYRGRREAKWLPQGPEGRPGRCRGGWGGTGPTASACGEARRRCRIPGGGRAALHVPAGRPGRAAAARERAGGGGWGGGVDVGGEGGAGTALTCGRLSAPLTTRWRPAPGARRLKRKERGGAPGPRLAVTSWRRARRPPAPPRAHSRKGGASARPPVGEGGCWGGREAVPPASRRYPRGGRRRGRAAAPPPGAGSGDGKSPVGPQRAGTNGRKRRGVGGVGGVPAPGPRPSEATHRRGLRGGTVSATAGRKEENPVSVSGLYYGPQ